MHPILLVSLFLFYFVSLDEETKKNIQRNLTKKGDRDTATAEANFSGPVFVISSIRISNSVICSVFKLA